MTYVLVFFGLAVIEAATLTAVVLLLRRVDMSGRPVQRVTVEYEDGTVQVTSHDPDHVLPGMRLPADPDAGGADV